jgi:hypothetical protein
MILFSKKWDKYKLIIILYKKNICKIINSLFMKIMSLAKIKVFLINWLKMEVNKKIMSHKT